MPRSGAMLSREKRASGAAAGTAAPGRSLRSDEGDGDRPSEAASAARTPAHAWSRDGDAAGDGDRRPRRGGESRRRLHRGGAARGGVRRRARRGRRPAPGFAPEGARSGTAEPRGGRRTPRAASPSARPRRRGRPSRSGARRRAPGACSSSPAEGRFGLFPADRPRSNMSSKSRSSSALVFTAASAGRPRARKPRPSQAARAPSCFIPRETPGRIRATDARTRRRRTPKAAVRPVRRQCAPRATVPAGVRARWRGMTPRRRGRRALSLRKAPIVRVSRAREAGSSVRKWRPRDGG